MPKSLLCAFLLGLFFPSRSQLLSISGKVNNDSKLEDSIEVNVPLAGEYYRSNSVFTPIDSSGAFKIDLRSNVTKFVQVLYGREQHWLLLTPGRPLFIELNPNSDRQKIIFQGAAKEENELLEQFEPIQGVSFTKKNGKGKIDIKYLSWTPDSLKSYLFPSIRSEITQKQEILSRSDLSNSLKQILSLDLEYYYANQFSKFVSAWTKRNGFRQWVSSLAGLSIDSFGMPSQLALEISQSANEWFIMKCTSSAVRANYKYYYETEATLADTQFQNQAGFSHKFFVDTLIKDFGGTYAEGVEGYHFVPEFARDRWLATRIELECELSDLKTAELLITKLRDSFPNSPFLAPCTEKVLALVNTRVEYRNSNAIHIRPDYRNISTLYDLLAPYKGKVVYLDLWGTWCGPCADEMQFASQLRDKFKDKSVLFLYVDDDEDKYDDRWRNYIAIRNIEGEHVRLTKERLAGIWEKLTSADHRNNYPTYFIINRSGEIEVSLAKRPSEQAEVFEQIVKVLNK